MMNKKPGRAFYLGFFCAYKCSELSKIEGSEYFSCYNTGLLKQSSGKSHIDIFILKPFIYASIFNMFYVKKRILNEEPYY